MVPIMLSVSFSLCRIWMVKFLSCPGESEYRLKQAASGSRQGEAKQELISLLWKKYNKQISSRFNKEPVKALKYFHEGF